MSHENLISVSLIAQDYGMSAIAFNKLLCDLKIQRKYGNTYLLYSKYLKKNYVCSDELTIVHSDNTIEKKLITKWTYEGREFLIKFLFEHGYKRSCDL